MSIKTSSSDPLPDGEGTLADYVPDDAPLTEEVFSEKAELNQLFERLQELMPEAKRIGELRKEGLSDEAIADEIFRMRKQKSQAETDTRSRKETRKRIAVLQDFIGSQQPEITESDESLVRKLNQQITVHDDHLADRFKSGLEINIEA